MKKAAILFGSAMVLAACDVENPSSGGQGGLPRGVPESVAALAAPGQDLSTVEMREDNCFWYRHVGPVESTMLPLRAADGRPICAIVEGAEGAA